MIEEEETKSLLKRAIPVQTDRGVMTALKNRKGVFKVTSVTHDYFMQTVNQPKIKPYYKSNKYSPVNNKILYELDIIK
jgi:hypothetical protein